ncbi:MAG TPA: virulence protein RhuM/Fic/DOC family protein [Ignavibacteria bacterium]|nr:virulence protein RhuM/Fic/DOC family protein [Ignavibacteria bacterium]HMR41183.1 virulence protein RhuM/Fic/DOC family protein [Ignavibacteria bacterium]
MKNSDQLIIYKTEDKKIQIEVKFEHQTVWLTQKQIAELFGTKRPAITKHLSNIFKTGELESESVSSILEHTASDNKRYKTTFYNLDAIISVGYRVNSRKATEFRIWATQRLKDYLIKGYSVNEKRLKETKKEFIELRRTIQLLETVINRKELTSDEATGLLKVVSDYSHALDTLDGYDHQTLKKPVSTTKEKFKITYEEAKKAIQVLKKKTGSQLFGNEKDKSFRSSLENIYVTYQKKELYPGAENKAAHLLYFITKNHSFSDGNKRIAAFLFIWYLDRNGLLYSKEGFKKIEDNTLVALTLMIAESKSEDKDMMIKVILNLMQKNN